MKRILFATDPQLDYGLDSLLVGLYEISEIDIYEYPEKLSLHGIVHSGYDLPGNPGGGMTGPPGFIINSPLPGPFHTKEEIFDIFPNYDLIIMGTRDYSHYAISELCNAKNISPEKLSNVIIVDAEDHSVISMELINKYQPLIFAKRELNNAYSLDAYAGHFGIPIVPCPFGAFIRGLPEVDDTQKDWDLFATFGQTNEIRNTILFRLINMIHAGALDRLFSWIGTNDNAKIYLENIGIMRPMMPWAEYISLQARSKIGLSVPGWGGDTLRHWELMSFATLCLYVHPNIHIPYPFRNREHCIYLGSNFSNLEDEITYYLQNTEESVEIATAGKQHCRTYHTASTRAQYLVDIAMKRLSGENIRWEEYEL